MSVAVYLVVCALGSAPETAADQPPDSTETSTQALFDLVAELNRIREVLTSTTSETSLSEEGREFLELEPAEVLEEEPPAPPEITEEDPRKFSLRLVYTGGSQGLSDERYRFDLPWLVAGTLGKGERVAAVNVTHGVLVQGAFVLTTNDRRMGSVVDFLQKGDIRCFLPEEARSVRTRAERLLYRVGEEWIPNERLPRWLRELGDELGVREYHVRICQNASGARALLYAPADGRAILSLPDWSLERFEFRRSLHLTIEGDGLKTGIDIVGVPRNEPARRFHLLEAAVNAADGTLFVDAGDFVDGSGRSSARSPSTRRKLTFEMLTRLRPAALVPGQTELLWGAKRFFDEMASLGLTYIATNWRSEDQALALPPSTQHTFMTTAGPLKVTFLSIIDPALADRIPKLEEDGILLADPVESVLEELKAIEFRGESPDLTILLTAAGPSVLAKLRRQVRGLDLIIGDVTQTSDAIDRSRFEMADMNGLAAAHILPFRDISRATLEIFREDRRWSLKAIDTSSYHTGEDVRPDARVTAILSKMRASRVALDRPLVTPKSAGPLAALTNDEWRNVVCEAVRAYTSADVVLLPELPEIERVPGTLSEALVSERLAVLDRLIVDEVRGEDLIGILGRAPAFISTACGGLIGEAVPLVLGREVNPARVYHIVSTDRALLLGLEEELDVIHEGRVFEPGPRLLTTARNEPISLRKAVLTALRRMRRESGLSAAPIEPLLETSATTRAPAWFAELGGLDIEIETFQGAEDEAFNQVPETLAKRASSFNIGLRGDAALLYDSTSLLADVRVRARYRRFSFSNGETQELDDDLRFSSSISLPGIALDVGPLAWMPFLEALFDTEITPLLRDGEDLPRQADLSLTLGLSTTADWLERFRFGAFALRSLSKGDSNANDYGLRSEARALFSLSRGMSASSTLDASLFGGPLVDDLSTLRFKVLFENRLILSITRALDLSAYLQVFAFQGRTEATDSLRASYLIGIALRLHGLLAL